MKKHLFCVSLVIASLFMAIPSYAKWKEKTVVDEFGDETGAVLFADTFSGTFSNSVTENKELTVDAKFQFASKGNNITAFVFKLLEYNDNPADFYDDIDITYKIDDEKNESVVYETSSAGTVFTCDSLSYGCPSGLTCDIAKALSEEKTVKCIITSGKSSYRFDLEPDGFGDLYEPAMYEFISNRIENNEDIDKFDATCYSRAFASLGDYEDAEELSKEYDDLYKKLKEESK